MLVKILSTQIVHNLPIIGKHHSTTPKAYQDGRNGDYWETYPQITQDGAKLQKALLNKKIVIVQTLLRCDAELMLLKQAVINV